MPNCFMLSRLSKPDEAVSLSVVDEEICAHMGMPVHPELYCCQWYDIIGFGVAMGQSFDDFMTDDFSERIQKIARFLKTNFTSEAWAEVGKRA